MAAERPRNEVPSIAQGQTRRVTLLQRFATRNDLRGQLATISLPTICKTQANNDWQLLCSPQQFTSQRKAGRGSPVYVVAPKPGRTSPRLRLATCALLSPPDTSARVPFRPPGGGGRGHRPRPIRKRYPVVPSTHPGLFVIQRRVTVNGLLTVNCPAPRYLT